MSEEPSLKIAVIGAGAMGSLFGGRLSKVTPVWLVDPWEEHVAAMQREGLHLVTPEGDEEVIPVQATTDPGQVPPCDLAIIFVKAHQTAWAAEQAARLLAPDGLALTLQNGLGNAEVIARFVGEARTVQGVTAQGATLLGPGRVRHAGRGPTHIASRPEVADRLTVVAETFNRAGLETHLVREGLESMVWGKLIINVGINALTALLRVPNGVIAQVPEVWALAEEAVNEAVAVAQALGIPLPYDDPPARVRAVAQATAANLSSMLQDVRRGAPTEIEAINGAVVREGERLGVPTPLNTCLVRLIRAVEATASVVL